MADGKSAQKEDDPGGVKAAIERYRDLAKYLITIFAAIGALLVAGTQLSAIGKLTWHSDKIRLIGALVALGLAIAAVAWIVWKVLAVLRPVQMSIEVIADDSELRREIEARPALLGGVTVNELRSRLSSELLTDPERAEWEEVEERVIAQAAYVRTEARFNKAWTQMVLGAFIGAVAITAFAWAANPPKKSSASTPAPIVRPKPTLVGFTLSHQGQTELADPLGKKCVTRQVIRALSVGGKEGAPRLVTIPEHGCKPAQFVLDPELGNAVSLDAAPGG